MDNEKKANAFLRSYSYLASQGDGIRFLEESLTRSDGEVKFDFSISRDGGEKEILLIFAEGLSPRRSRGLSFFVWEAVITQGLSS